MIITFTPMNPAAGNKGIYFYGASSRRDYEGKATGRSAKLAPPSPAAKRDGANWIEADNDLSDIESSLQPIGAKTNLLSLLNIVGAQENVDYNEIALYGEEPQTYAQAVMSFEDYDLIIGEELEEDPGNPPEPGNQDRCTFSRYWPFVNHELDCDPVIYFYHSDYLGHTEFITDRNGQAQFFHYSAFGEALIEEHSGQGTHTDYFRFNGKELDPETGNYYYGARSRRDYEDKATGRSAKLARPSPADKRGYYDPRVSVWLSVDRMASKYPDWSPYNFTMNNPMNMIDPNGDSVLAVYNRASNSLEVIDMDHYDPDLPTDYVEPDDYKVGGVYDEDGNLTRNQVLVIEGVFSGGKADGEGNVTYGNNDNQIPIPKGVFEILDHDAGGWFRLDAKDSKPRNDRYDNSSVRNAQGELRGQFRLHEGTLSHGCVTCNSNNSKAVKGYNVLIQLLNQTSTSSVKDNRGRASWLFNRTATKYGEVSVR